MILKGTLNELSKSVIIHDPKKSQIEVVKYDYIDIGGTHQRDCVTSTYLSNFLSNKVGEEVAIAYVKKNMTNSLGRETIHIGGAPKHALIIGIKDSNGKIIMDKQVIELKGNQTNPVTGCLRNFVLIFPIWGIMWYLWSRNSASLTFMLLTVSGFILFILNMKRRRKGLESKMRSELERS